MSISVKSDKYRLLERRGQGRGIEYHPWIKTHELSAISVKHRLLGWKIRRIYQLISTLEYMYFLTVQWEDNVIDIREQFPLLPIEQTIFIAEELGIRYPSLFKRNGEEIVMTSDFVITIKNGDNIYDIVRTVKTMNDLAKKRTREKLKIEEEFYNKKGSDWGIVTEQQINFVLANNLDYLYNDYFWAEDRNFDEVQVSNYIHDFIYFFKKKDYNVYETVNIFDKYMEWDTGESLNFFKYLLVKKRIFFDFNKKLDFRYSNFWLP